MKRDLSLSWANVLASLLFCLWASPLCAAPQEPTATARGSNVILMILDQVSPEDWASAKGCPGLSPWQDSGTSFSRALAQSDGRAEGRAAILAESTRLADQKQPFAALCSQFDQHAVIGRAGLGFFPSESVTAEAKTANVALSQARSLIESAPGSFFVALQLHDATFKFGEAGSPTDRATRLNCAIAEFMAWFSQHGAFDDTLLVVIGDAARDAVTAPGVPLWLSGLGLPRGVTEEHLGVAQIDVMPTIFDFLGWDWPQSRGQSLYRLMEMRPERDLVCASEARELPVDFVSNAETIPMELQATEEVVLQRGRFKVVHDRVKNVWSLFDDLRDPAGVRDLSREEPDLLRQMQGRLEHWMRLQSWRLLSTRLH